MAKYSTFRYNSGTKYGTGDPAPSPAFTGSIVWTLQIDWFPGNVSFAGTNEAENMLGLKISRGKRFYVAANGEGLEPVPAGSATIELDNSDRRYDPYNVSGPLYGYILPGRKVQIGVMIVATGETKLLFTGHITDIQPSSQIDRVTISCEDGLRWLQDADFAVDAIYTQKIHNCINKVLDIVKWPYARSIYDSIQPVQIFEPKEGFGLDLIRELAEANIGTFFVDRAGAAVFYPINKSAADTYAVDQSTLLKEIRVPQPWETVRNKIVIVANRRGKRPAAEVWTFGGADEFAAGETKTYEATYPTSTGIQTPALGSDLIANTSPDGTGFNVTGFFSASISNLSTTGCTITVTSTYTAKSYMVMLRLIGQEIVSSPEKKRASDATSIETYGPRRFSLDNPWMQDRNFAATYALWLKAFLKNPQVNPIIQVEQRPDIQYAPDLFDNIALSVDALGINDTFRLGGIDHEWQTETGQSVITTMYLQKMLVDATPITPAPYYPGLPPVPYIPPPWKPPILPPVPIDPPPGDSCLQPTAGTTGPFLTSSTPASMTSQAENPFMLIHFPCTLRPAGVALSSYLILKGAWEAQFGTASYGDTGGKWWHVHAMDVGMTNEVLDGTISVDMFGNKRVDFQPAGPLPIGGFKIDIDKPPSGNIYYATGIYKLLGDYADYGGSFQNVNNILGAPDGNFASLVKASNFGYGNIVCEFQVKPFPVGCTVRRHTSLGHYRGGVVYSYNVDGRPFQGSTENSFTATFDFDYVFAHFDSWSTDTEYCDALSVTTPDTIFKIRIDEANVNNVCAYSG